MKSDNTKQAFLEHLKKQSLRIDELLPHQGIEAMLSFYTSLRIDGCDLEEDGDMLLYQWGSYDWGEGEFFDYNITRQLIINEHEDDDIWQLSLTFRFIPNESLVALKSGEIWCHLLDELGEFRNMIEESAAYQKIKNLTPEQVELTFECAG